MAEIGLPQPEHNVGIRGNPQSLPQYQKHEAIASPGGVPNFVSAFDSYASEPTMLGIIGSKLQQTASNALAVKFGQSLGKEPYGNLFPPITNFDKAVSESYTQQAQVTLGNQATSVMLDAQTEMAKADKLTPDLIKTYTQNVGASLHDTLQMAPDNLKPVFEQQFSQQLLRTTNQYNLKLISQNKEKAESEAAVWRIHQNDYVTNQIKDAKSPADFERAKIGYEALLGNIAASNLSSSQKETAATTAKLNYESALSIQKLMVARSNNRADEYLASIADKKIGDLSWSESEAVRDNTVRYLSAVETAENRDQSLLVSEAQLEMAQGTFNESSLAALRGQLRPTNYNHVATQFAISQRKAHVENVVQQRISAYPSDATTYAGLTPKQINEGFDNWTKYFSDKAQNDGKAITQSEAEFRAQDKMNTIVPKYIDKINRQMLNGNAQQILEGYETATRLHELDGNKVIGIEPKALAVGTMFKNFLTSNPDSNPDIIQEALAKTKDSVFNKSDAQIKTNTEFYTKYERSVSKTPQNRLSNALSLSGLSHGKDIEDSATFMNDIYSRMQNYMQLTNSDVQASKELVQQDVAKIWGESRINGESKIVKLGVEKALDLPLNAAPLIQEDVIGQLKPQLEMSKKLYDAGAAPSYWRIKEDRIDYNKYAEAKLAVMNEGLKDPDYATHKQIIKEYEKAPPIIIEQVHKNGLKEWHVNVQSSPYIARSAVDNKVYGYDIGIKDPKSGMPGHLFAYYGSTKTIPSYQPNEDFIRTRYNGLSVNNEMTPEHYVTREQGRQNIEKQLEENRQKVIFGRSS